MSSDNVKSTIREYIRTRFMIGRAVDDFKDSDSLLEKSVIDSTGVLEFVGYLEETFGIKIEDEDLVPENLDSVDNAVSFVLHKAAVGN
jgi:acyl carrier protein